jgi:hypothetical protein
MAAVNASLPADSFPLRLISRPPLYSPVGTGYVDSGATFSLPAESQFCKLPFQVFFVWENKTPDLVKGRVQVIMALDSVDRALGRAAGQPAALFGLVSTLTDWIVIKYCPSTLPGYPLAIQESAISLRFVLASHNRCREQIGQFDIDTLHNEHRLEGLLHKLMGLFREVVEVGNTCIKEYTRTSETAVMKQQAVDMKDRVEKAKEMADGVNIGTGLPLYGSSFSSDR